MNTYEGLLTMGIVSNSKCICGQDPGGFDQWCGEYEYGKRIRHDAERIARVTEVLCFQIIDSSFSKEVSLNENEFFLL